MDSSTPQPTSDNLPTVSRTELWALYDTLMADTSVRRVTRDVLYVLIKGADAWGFSFRSLFKLGSLAGCCEQSARNALLQLRSRGYAYVSPFGAYTDRHRWQQRSNGVLLYPAGDAPPSPPPVHDGTKGSRRNVERFADWAMALAHRISRITIIDFAAWQRDLMHVSSATAAQVRAAADRFRGAGISDAEASRVMASMMISWDNAKVGSDPTETLEKLIYYRRTVQAQRPRGRPRTDAKSLLGPLYEPTPLPRLPEPVSVRMDDLLDDAKLRGLWASTILPAMEVPRTIKDMAFAGALLFRRRSDPRNIIIAAQDDAHLQRLREYAFTIRSQIQSIFPDVSVAYTTIPPS